MPQTFSHGRRQYCRAKLRFLSELPIVAVPQAREDRCCWRVAQPPETNPQERQQQHEQHIDDARQQEANPC
jgi:hypothetical protein